MRDPDSVSFQTEQYLSMSPVDRALTDGRYEPGIVAAMVERARNRSIEAIRSKSDDPEWQEVAMRGMDSSRGYEDVALTELEEMGIQIPADDPEYVEIIERQVGETIDKL